ncbi:unnamed protein product [Effrenium voratum]|nr:unnamed protein product [Effrenium voratum]
MSRLWKQVTRRSTAQPSRPSRPDPAKASAKAVAKASAEPEPIASEAAADEVLASSVPGDGQIEPIVALQLEVQPAEPLESPVLEDDLPPGAWSEMLRQNIQDMGMAVDRARMPRADFDAEQTAEASGWSGSGAWHLQSEDLQKRFIPVALAQPPQEPAPRTSPAYPTYLAAHTAACGADLREAERPPPPPPPPRGPPARATSPVELRDAQPDSQSSAAEEAKPPATACKRCQLNSLEVSMVSQSFVGLAARVLHWAGDLGRARRKALEATVLEYALPCQHLSPEIRFLSQELQNSKGDEGDDGLEERLQTLQRHLAQLSEDYAKVVEDNSALQKKLKALSELQSAELQKARAAETAEVETGETARDLHAKLQLGDQLPPLKLPRNPAEPAASTSSGAVLFEASPKPMDEASPVASPKAAKPRGAPNAVVKPRRTTWHPRAEGPEEHDTLRLLWDGLPLSSSASFREELLSRFQLLGFPQSRLGRLVVQVHPAGPNSIMAAVQGPEEDIRYFQTLPLGTLAMMGCKTQVLSHGRNSAQGPKAPGKGCSRAQWLQWFEGTSFDRQLLEAAFSLADPARDGWVDVEKVRQGGFLVEKARAALRRWGAAHGATWLAVWIWSRLSWPARRPKRRPGRKTSPCPSGTWPLRRRSLRRLQRGPHRRKSSRGSREAAPRERQVVPPGRLRASRRRRARNPAVRTEERQLSASKPGEKPQEEKLGEAAAEQTEKQHQQKHQQKREQKYQHKSKGRSRKKQHHPKKHQHLKKHHLRHHHPRKHHRPHHHPRKHHHHPHHHPHRHPRILRQQHRGKRHRNRQ